MKGKERSSFVWNSLRTLYPDVECTLEVEEDPFRLFVRGILSAQCTDFRVNEVCRTLFLKYPDMEAFARAKEEAVGEDIRACGLYRAKARGLVRSSHILIEKYGGTIPSDPRILETLPGVGRKIANLVAGEIYGVPAIVVDTHCGRVSHRLGLSQSTVPAKIEKDLMRQFPESQWITLGHLMVAHGRSLCMARTPHCEDCPMRKVCDFGKKRFAEKK